MISNGCQIEFKWKLGVHCSTTATMNLLSYFGLDLDEDLIFGVGKGLGFVYFRYKDYPYPYISGRGNSLIDNTLKNFGFFPRINGGDYSHQLQKIIDRLHHSVPVIVVTDMNCLSYISNNLLKLMQYYPFSEHHVLIVGYEEYQGGLYLWLKDHLWPVLKIDSSIFKTAWAAERIKPFPLYNYFYEVNLYNTGIDNQAFKEIIRYAILCNIHELIHPYNPVNSFSGLKGMDSFYRDFVQLSECRDHEVFRNTISMIYYPLEKIGTGGGNFRRIYGRFLLKITPILGKSELENIGKDYLGLANRWKEFIKILEYKLATARSSVEHPDQLLLKEIIDEEKRLALNLYNAIKF